jgi:hypothetical protein
MPVKIEVWDHLEILGETTFTVNEIKKKQGQSLQFVDKKNNKESGKLVI